MRAFLIAWSTVALFLLAILSYGAAGWLLFGRTLEFGPNDPRAWFLVRGTMVDQLGVTNPITGSVRYLAEPQDGNSPPRLFVTFRTSLSARGAIQHYARRCVEVGAVAEQGDEIGMVCRRGSAEVGITSTEFGSASEVTIGGWITAP